MPTTVSLRSSATRLEPLTAREREQLVGELGAALGGGAHIAEPLREPAVDARGREPLLQELDIAEHHGQKVVEVVRDAGGQLADRLQPLHLPQGRFRPARAPRSGRGAGGWPRRAPAVRSSTRNSSSSLSRRHSYCRRRPAQAGLHDADQRRRMERPLEEGDVAEQSRSDGPRPGCARGRRHARSARRRENPDQGGCAAIQSTRCSAVGTARRFLGENRRRRHPRRISCTSSARSTQMSTSDTRISQDTLWRRRRRARAAPGSGCVRIWAAISAHGASPIRGSRFPT